MGAGAGQDGRGKEAKLGGYLVVPDEGCPFLRDGVPGDSLEVAALVRGQSRCLPMSLLILCKTPEQSAGIDNRLLLLTFADVLPGISTLPFKTSTTLGSNYRFDNLVSG